MARSVRVEFAGAIYHVLNRGNYRKDLFTVGESGGWFVRALQEASEQCGWRVHAYVVMSNHYHLVVETPEPNLVDGMHWLQTTFSSRFNRSMGERGHVFQGRYKALLVAPGAPFTGVVNYVHLNPVRAGLCAVEDLSDYALGSYGRFFQKNRPDWLVRREFLDQLRLPDSLKGMNAYAKILALADERDPAKREALDREYCRGWLIGDAAYRKHILARMSGLELRGSHRGEDVRALKEHRWEQALAEQLRLHEKSPADLARAPKSADWKIAIARHMRTHTRATNPWLATKLSMGHPSRVSNLIYER
ncbi:MAG: transposase [Verrucomicrobiota bacterium JB024]|nr:transposase [Verrucomicrobiota bacterium JB024]